MISKSTIKISRHYCEAIDPIGGIPFHADFYRFKRVRKYLFGTSVLDVGCGRADFLNSIKPDHQIAGTEVNKKRVDHCKHVLRQDTVKLGNLEKGLEFEDSSFDAVTCLEVLEHLEDPQKALAELVRISRKRVIITVPFNEKIQNMLCIHCARYTPLSGYLHSFNKENIRSVVPDNAKVVTIKLLCSGTLNYFPGLNLLFRLPVFIILPIDNILNSVIPRARWMMVILDKNDSADNCLS